MPHDQMFPKWKHLIYRYGITRSPSCGSFCCLVIPLLRTSGKDEAMKGIPKTPVEFDYDLWTTEDGKCMVRIKSTGEVTEVDREVMKALRAEEKWMRRKMTGAPVPGAEEATATVLSLDFVSFEGGEDMSPAWLEDPHDYMDEVITKQLEQDFLTTLTAKEKDVYLHCVQGGKSQQQYADVSGLSASRVCKLVGAVRKKAKNFF